MTDEVFKSLMKDIFLSELCDMGIQQKKDIQAIRVFLSNPEKTFPFFQAIEDDLEKIALEKGQLEDKKLKGFVKNKPYKHNKLLSSYCRQQAQDAGFKGYTRLKGMLDEESFHTMLSLGGLFKDNILRGTDHGDFTHLIQWILILKWNQENPDVPKLQCKPADLFSWIGTQKEDPYIWARTFEGNDTVYKEQQLNFRSPLSIQEYLLSDHCKDRFPVLHQLIAGRHAKGIRIFSYEEPYSFNDFEVKI